MEYLRICYLLIIIVYWEKTNNFCERSERVALLVTGNEVSLVVNVKVKVGKIHNTGWGVNMGFGCLNN